MKSLQILTAGATVATAFINPALAENIRPMIWTKGNLVVHKFTPKVCTNDALSGYYKMTNSGTAGRIYGCVPREYGYMYAFQDTNGKERCRGNVQLMGDAGDFGQPGISGVLWKDIDAAQSVKSMMYGT